MMMRGRPRLPLLACIGFAMIWLVPAGASAESQCSCRYAGQSYALGTCVCIDRPGIGPQYACCGMVLNNTSWQFSDKGCPTAMSEPADPLRMGTASSGDLADGVAFARPTSDRQ